MAGNVALETMWNMQPTCSLEYAWAAGWSTLGKANHQLYKCRAEQGCA